MIITNVSGLVVIGDGITAFGLTDNSAMLIQQGPLCKMHVHLVWNSIAGVIGLPLIVRLPRRAISMTGGTEEGAWQGSFAGLDTDNGGGAGTERQIVGAISVGVGSNGFSHCFFGRARDNNTNETVLANSCSANGVIGGWFTWVTDDFSTDVIKGL
jgi:hypothetical protein